METAQLPSSSTGFAPTSFAVRAVSVIAVGSAIARLGLAVQTAHIGDLEPLTAYGFSVVFPLTLIALILSLGPGRTREGILMRLGTMLQLILIIALPRFSLYLVLGFPVAFLAVELFETRLPRIIHDPIVAWLVRC